MTFTELKALLDTLTPEQLSHPVRWWGDEDGGEITGLLTLEEDFISVDGEPLCQESAYSQAEIEEGEISCRMIKGTPVLIADDTEMSHPVLINGDIYDVLSPLTYEKLVATAGMFGTPTVTYVRGPADNLEGILAPGKAVVVCAGMIFNVIHTGAA